MRLLLWLCAIKIAALILVLDPAGLVAFQLPKALASRAIEWLIAAAVVFAFLRDGTAAVVRHRLQYVVLALVVISALSGMFAVDRYVAVFGDAENYAGLGFLLDMVLLYLAVTIAVRDDRDVLFLLGSAGVAGAIAIAYAAAQAFGLDPFAWAADPRSRPFSTFGNPDHFGHFLSVFFGITLGIATTASDARARVLGAIGVAASLVASAVVATRATLLGIGAAVLALVLVQRPRARVLVAGAAVTVVIAAGLALTPLGQRVSGGGRVADRIELWRIALDATFSRPLLGYGPDNFRAAFAANRTAESIPLLGSGPQATAHDWILDASATTGLAGLLALLAFVAVGTLELWRLAKERPSVGLPLLLGWAGYWADGLVAASSLAAVWFPWIALGSAVALRGARPVRRARRDVPRWIGAVLALIALIGAATGARTLQANRDAWSAEDAAQAGDRNDAFVYADRAAARDGGRADYWNRLGLAFEALERRDAAVAAYREATNRQPYEVVYWANLARSLARVSATNPSLRDEAIAAARQATTVDKNVPTGYVVLAEIAISFGRCDVARDAAARAAGLEPGHEQLVQRAASCR